VTAEADIAVIADGGESTAAEARTAWTSVLARTWDKVTFPITSYTQITGVVTVLVNSRWPSVAYDASTAEGAAWGGFVLPDSWATVELWIAWTKLSSSGDVIWGGNLDAAADGESTAVTGLAFDDTTITAPTNSLVSIDQIGAAIAVVPSTDVMNLRLFRRANVAEDTLTVDANLLAVWLVRAS
jgi:hypothetical protein